MSGPAKQSAVGQMSGCPPRIVRDFPSWAPPTMAIPLRPRPTARPPSLALARAEFRQEARYYGSASVIVAIGAAFGLLAAMALIAAGIIALARYTGLVTSSLIFGGTLTLIAALAISRGVHHFRHHSS